MDGEDFERLLFLVFVMDLDETDRFDGGVDVVFVSIVRCSLRAVMIVFALSLSKRAIRMLLFQ